MDSRLAASALPIAERHFACSKSDRESELAVHAVNCMRQGIPDEEIPAALDEYIATHKWDDLEYKSHQEIVEDARVIQWAFELQYAPQPPAERMQSVSLNAVQPEPVRWLWPGKIPLGKVTVVYGEAATGKTCWSLDLATRVAAGIDWPQLPCTPSAGPAPGPGRVLLLNGEDDLADTIRPRLAAAGPRSQNVIAITGMTSTTRAAAADEQRDVDLERDIPLLRQQIVALGDVRLVIIDPLEAYCKSGPRTQRMRTLMAALGKLAKECGVAIVVISARKQCDLPVKNVWRVDGDVRYPELRWWVPVRCNFGRLREGMAFRVTDTGIEWDLRAYSIPPGQLQGCTAKQERNERKRELNMFLMTALALGACPAKEVLREGASYGWSASQIKRAKKPLHVNTYKEARPKGQWMWELTEQSVVGITSPTERPPVLPPRPSEEPVPELQEDVFVPPQPKPADRPSVAAVPDQVHSNSPVLSAEEAQEAFRQWQKDWDDYVKKHP